MSFDCYERRIKKASFYTRKLIDHFEKLPNQLLIYMTIKQKNEKDLRIFHLSLVA